MARIVHIRDPHVVTPPRLVSGWLDTPALLKRAVARIAARLPKIAPVDALLVTKMR